MKIFGLKLLSPMDRAANLVNIMCETAELKRNAQGQYKYVVPKENIQSMVDKRMLLTKYSNSVDDKIGKLLNRKG